MSNRKLRIAFFSDLAGKSGGGAETQLEKTMSHLRKQNCEIELINKPHEAGGYDLIHLFRISDEVVRFYRELPKQRPPVLLTTIFWSEIIPLDQVCFSPIDYAVTGWKRMTRRIRGWHRGLKNFQGIRAMLQSVDMLLPNSELEAGHLREIFSWIPRYHVIPNAVDSSVFTVNQQASPQVMDGDFVLSVGRFDEVKNRFNLVRAMKSAEMPLVIIGAFPDKGRYRRMRKSLERERSEKCIFLPPVDQRDLWAYYRAARVHALPSWYETTGLSSLEAAACGCAVVVSDRGGVREYFGSDAFYCDPGDPASIAAAVKQAWDAGPSVRLRDRIRKEFTWEVAARRTREAYDSVLDSGRMAERRKAVFFDRDGTLIAEKHYLCDPEGVELMPGASEVLASLKRKGYLNIVISNQAGIARGYYGPAEVERVNSRINQLLGGMIDAFYFCPHHPDISGQCKCRKPLTGLVEQACGKYSIDPGRSLFIGDKLSDVECGERAGMKSSFLVMTGYGREELERAGEKKIKVLDDLMHLLEHLD
ncbi:MAG: HAD-IIIA family hydrolase [Candidatus Wallbacteria bacterium]|nr:HAD-IIIA family hydrolase [Candidatus Wallbacteria bacterium]